MKSTPLFSVVIPTRHRNDLLAKCLDCLAPGVQILSSECYEVIVSDDGVESTAEMMIKEQYPWVKWVPGPCKGPAANRNNGARYAEGEWLAFTDDDCLPDPQWLRAYEEVTTPVILVYEGKTTCQAGIHSPLEHAPINLTGGYLWSCNMMIQKKLFEILNGFDERFLYPHMEDVDLRDRILTKVNKILFVENAIVDHPPKKLPWGTEIAKFHASDIYYFEKNKLNFFPLNFSFYVIKARLAAVKRCKIQYDSLLALISLFIEIYYILIKLPSNKR